MQTIGSGASPTMTICDSELVQQANAGSQQAFEVLIQRYDAALFRFVYAFLGDYDRACDVWQQVLIQLYLSLPTIQKGRSLKPWLFQVAHNRCIDELRRKYMVHFSDLAYDGEEDDYPVLNAIPDPTPLPEEIAEQHAVQENLCKAIQSLPCKFREIVVLRYTSQMTYLEIGETLGIPEATAKTYFQRAKPLLRESLANMSAFS